jgi:nickel/cobalt transporter (NicO) family protein
MRRTVMLAGLGMVLVLGLLWATGANDWLLASAREAQKDVQNAMARAVRALRGGQPGAFSALMAVCFGYGFFHAVGPGHGKVLIGGYGVARRVRMLPLAGLALASSLAQAAVAVGLVATGMLVLGWTRERLLDVGEGAMTRVGHVLVGLVGVWLMWRGLRGVMRVQAHADHDLDHGHVHDAHCGHAHAPTPGDMAHLTGWRDTVALIAGIAIRPCSGALFLLIITWQMGIAAAGIAGTFAMGLGTASVTIAVALLSVWAREGALAALPTDRIARALPVLELVAGSIIALIAVQLLWHHA